MAGQQFVTLIDKSAEETMWPAPASIHNADYYAVVEKRTSFAGYVPETPALIPVLNHQLVISTWNVVTPVQFVVHVSQKVYDSLAVGDSVSFVLINAEL